MRASSVSIAAALMLGSGLFAEPATQPTSHPESFHKTITKSLEMDYLVYLPKTYAEAGPKSPLLVLLHGSGECGRNLKKVEPIGQSILSNHPDLPC
jgi:poly(3-hydroxybutyrate) depolymerase